MDTQISNIKYAEVVFGVAKKLEAGKLFVYRVKRYGKFTDLEIYSSGKFGQPMTGSALIEVHQAGVVPKIFASVRSP